MITDAQLRDMLSVAMSAQDNAYSPYYHFKVGAALLAESGKIFAGCNVENASGSAHNGCAESNAIAAAVVAGEKVFRAVLVLGPNPDFLYPCGACRQKLHEFSPHMDVISAQRNGGTQTHALKELFPFAMGVDAFKVAL